MSKIRVSSSIELHDEKDGRCAPSNDFESGSCIRLDILTEMANAYNKHLKHIKSSEPLIKINQKDEVFHPKRYKKKLIKEFYTRLEDVCDKSQRCWMKQEFVRKMKSDKKLYLKKNTFRPKGPDGKFEWLNTINIRDVVDQYNHIYDEFDWLGAVPMDFDDLPEYGIRNYDFSTKWKDGIRKIGVVFNTDEHYKPGEHWIAMYSNLEKGQIYFFDSYGEHPDKRVVKLMDRIKKWCKKERGIKHIDFRYNTIRHQRKNTECGVYSINFILRSLKGESFDDITKNITTDKEINKCRKVYFT